MSAPMPGASAPERARNNLEELGMDAMASSAAEYAALVASGAKTFPQALMEMTDAQVAAVRARDLDRRVDAFSQVRIDRMICRKSTLRSRG